MLAMTGKYYQGNSSPLSSVTFSKSRMSVSLFNSFVANVPILYPLKKTGSQKFEKIGEIFGHFEMFGDLEISLHLHKN